LGKRWTENQFVEESKRAVHPFDQKVILDPDLARCVFEAATRGPADLAKYRAEVVKKYLSLAKDFADEEKKLHRDLPPSVEKVVKGKRILLFAKMLRDCDHDDVGVAWLLVYGIRLIGELADLGF